MKEDNVMYRMIYFDSFDILNLHKDPNAIFLFRVYMSYVSNNAKLRYAPRLEEFFMMALKNVIIINYDLNGKISPDTGFYVLVKKNLQFDPGYSVEDVDGDINNKFVTQLFDEISDRVNEWRGTRTFQDYLSILNIGETNYKVKYVMNRLGLKTMRDLYFYSYAFRIAYSAAGETSFTQVYAGYKELPYWYNAELLQRICEYRKYYDLGGIPCVQSDHDPITIYKYKIDKMQEKRRRREEEERKEEMRRLEEIRKEDERRCQEEHREQMRRLEEIRREQDRLEEIRYQEERKEELCRLEKIRREEMYAERKRMRRFGRYLDKILDDQLQRNCDLYNETKIKFRPKQNDGYVLEALDIGIDTEPISSIEDIFYLMGASSSKPLSYQEIERAKNGCCFGALV